MPHPCPSFRSEDRAEVSCGYVTTLHKEPRALFPEDGTQVQALFNFFDEKHRKLAYRPWPQLGYSFYDAVHSPDYADVAHTQHGHTNYRLAWALS